jgi:hypothetical protein
VGGRVIAAHLLIAAGQQWILNSVCHNRADRYYSGVSSGHRPEFCSQQKMTQMVYLHVTFEAISRRRRTLLDFDAGVIDQNIPGCDLLGKSRY